MADSPDTRVTPLRRRLLLALEFTAVFAGIPAALVLLVPNAFVLPVLWAAALVCWLVLRRDRTFDRARLWRTSGWRPALDVVLVRFALAAAGMVAAVLVFLPGEFLNLVRTKPLIWALIMVIYPLLSVVPQGIVYRAFLFHRYRGMVSRKALLALGAVAFSLGHLPFGNAWALGLTLVGGLFFGSTYLKSGSVLLSSIEHSLYGCLVFTVGFGAYFLHGTTRLAQMLGHSP